MRRLPLALLVPLLAACATPLSPTERAQQAIARYGPACEALGLAFGQPEFARCVLAHQDRADEAEAAAWSAVAGSLNQTSEQIRGTWTTCAYGGGAATCTSY